MKNIIMMFVAVSMTAPAFAGAKVLDYKTCTEAEVRAVADEILSAPTAKEAEVLADRSKIYLIFQRDDLAGLASELDGRFAAKGVLGPYWTYNTPWRQTTELRLATCADKCPVLVSVLKKYGGSYPKCTLDEAVALINEGVAHRDVGLYQTVRAFENFAKAISASALPLVRKHLRRQGKSFVTKDGVNPCEPYMSGLAAALNAPRFKGLNEWLANIGVSASVDFSEFPSEKEVSDLKEKILDGEVEISDAHKLVLYLGLGPDGYNAFVKEYNGEK